MECVAAYWEARRLDCNNPKFVNDTLYHGIKRFMVESRQSFWLERSNTCCRPMHWVLFEAKSPENKTRNSKDVLYIARCMTGSYVREEPFAWLKNKYFHDLDAYIAQSNLITVN